MTRARDRDDASDPGDRSALPRTIERQLALGFGLVATLAIVMCGLLMVLVHDVGATVEQMRRDEVSIRKGLGLAAAVREQYIHIAHSTIEGDRSHLDHYAEWVDDLEAAGAALRPDVPSEVAWRLDTLMRLSRKMDAVFRGTLLPATEQGAVLEVRRAHTRVEQMSGEAAGHADAIAMAVEQRMAAEHESARRSIRLGLGMACLCVVAVIGVALGFTLRLRAAVLRPLAALTDAARRFARGDFRHRVGELGRGELLQVSRALDHMAHELAEREARLVGAERMAAIGQLAAGIAHEMNNPIGIIRGYVATMIPEAESERFREELRIMDEEAGACQRLAEDLLAYAQTPTLALDAIDMPEFLRDTMRRLAELGALASHPIRVQADPGEVAGDRARLRQVLTNLILNAAAASPAGSSIDIGGRAEPGGGYTITVRDRGPGVDPTDRPRIFEPFFSRQPGGTGLGLAVSDSLVRAHGGVLEVDGADDGPGAVFRVRLAEPPSARASRGGTA